MKKQEDEEISRGDAEARRGENLERHFTDFQEPRLLRRFMAPMHSKTERGLSMNLKNSWSINSSRELLLIEYTAPDGAQNFFQVLMTTDMALLTELGKRAAGKNDCPFDYSNPLRAYNP